MKLTASPPCRSVSMLAKALGIKLNLKPINPQLQEHLTPEFLKINPQHTIPTLVDNGFAIWESRAILGYLVDKYSIDDSLYPKDPRKRAVVNQRLYFDMGTLYNRLIGKGGFWNALQCWVDKFYEFLFSDYFWPQIRFKQPANPESQKKLEEALQLLDVFLAITEYAAGDNATIADYSLIVSVSSLDAIGYDFSHFKNLSRWYALCNSSLPGIEANLEGIAAMKEYFRKAKDQA